MEPKKCVTCGHKFIVKTYKRFCFKCKKPVIKRHKVTYIPQEQKGIFKLQHWDCDNPESYGKKYQCGGEIPNDR